MGKNKITQDLQADQSWGLRGSCCYKHKQDFATITTRLTQFWPTQEEWVVGWAYTGAGRRGGQQLEVGRA